MATSGRLYVAVLTKGEVQQLARDAALDAVAALESRRQVPLRRRPLHRLWAWLAWLTTRRLG